MMKLLSLTLALLVSLIAPALATSYNPATWYYQTGDTFPTEYFNAQTGNYVLYSDAGFQAWMALIPDNGWKVTGTSNNGSGLIRVTLSAVPNAGTGNNNPCVDVPGSSGTTYWPINGVTGTTEANGSWKCTQIAYNPVAGTATVDLTGSTYTHAWISGGIFGGINQWDTQAHLFAYMNSYNAVNFSSASLQKLTVNSGTTPLSLTAPFSTTYEVAAATLGCCVVHLPLGASFTSPPLGGVLHIINNGSYAFPLRDIGESYVNAIVLPGEEAEVILTAQLDGGGSANGTWSIKVVPVSISYSDNSAATPTLSRPSGTGQFSVPILDGGQYAWQAATMSGDCSLSVGVITCPNKITPYYLTNNWYAPFGIYTHATGAATTANTIYCVYGYVTFPVTIKTIGVYLVTGITTDKLQLAIYSQSGGTLTLVDKTGDISAGTAQSASAINGAVGNTTDALSPGTLYAFCENSQGAMAFDSVNSGGISQAQLVGSATQANVAGGTGVTITGRSISQTYNTWPGTITESGMSDVTGLLVAVPNFQVNWLLERDMNPAANDNSPAFLAMVG